MIFYRALIYQCLPKPKLNRIKQLNILQRGIMDISAKIYRIIRYRIVGMYNEIILTFLGKKWNVILINEYPKCGASWLRKMLSSYLNVELSNGNINSKRIMQLISKNAIIQRHWLRDKINLNNKINKIIIVIRDPRDVYNSFYFYQTYFQPQQEFLKRYGYSKNDDERENMTRYIKYKLRCPESSGTPSFSYKDFWSKYKNCRKAHIIKYEDLHKNTSVEIENILRYIGISNINHKKIRDVIEINSFKMVTKTAIGEENKMKHARKGIIGDWKNNFNSETICIVKKYLNDLIIDLGYENNPNW